MKIYIRKSKVFYTALVAFILVIGMSFSENFHRTAEVFKANLEIEKIERQGYKDYNVLGETFGFSIPSSWDTLEENFAGGEIIYHLSFISSDKKINGFIQVWQIGKSLSQFIEESEKSSVAAIEFKSYTKKEVIVNDNKGFLIQYERPNVKGKVYKGYEVFLENGGNIYRASFFTEGKNWRKYYIIIYNRIIQSFKIK